VLCLDRSGEKGAFLLFAELFHYEEMSKLCKSAAGRNRSARWREERLDIESQRIAGGQL